MINWLFNLFCKKQECLKLNNIEVNLGKNDILVLHTEKVLSEKEMNYIKDCWNKHINENAKLIVLPEGFTYSVIHRE